MKRLNRSRWITAIALSVLFPVTLLAIRASGVVGTSGRVASAAGLVNPPFDAATSGEWASGFGIEFSQMAAPGGSVALAVAERNAEDAYAGVISPERVSGVTLVSARFGLITEDHRCQRTPRGSCQLILDHHPVWVLTYAHANVPYKGPTPPGVDMAKVRFEADASVVVDGASGKALDMFAIGRRVA